VPLFWPKNVERFFFVVASSKCGYLQDEPNVDFDIYVITYNEQLADIFKTKNRRYKSKTQKEVTITL
jgi:hypothetical protein